MRHLTIIYNPGTGPIQLYDGPVDELAWSDTETQVAITGRRKRAANPSAAVAGIGDLLAKASKARTQAAADKLKESADD